jgi:hypothetical protein
MKLQQQQLTPTKIQRKKSAASFETFYKLPFARHEIFASFKPFKKQW